MKRFPSPSQNMRRLVLLVFLAIGTIGSNIGTVLGEVIPNATDTGVVNPISVDNVPTIVPTVVPVTPFDRLKDKLDQLKLDAIGAINYGPIFGGGDVDGNRVNLDDDNNANNDNDNNDNNGNNNQNGVIVLGSDNEVIYANINLNLNFNPNQNRNMNHNFNGKISIVDDNPTVTETNPTIGTNENKDKETVGGIINYGPIFGGGKTGRSRIDRDLDNNDNNDNDNNDQNKNGNNNHIIIKGSRNQFRYENWNLNLNLNENLNWNDNLNRNEVDHKSS